MNMKKTQTRSSRTDGMKASSSNAVLLCRAGSNRRAQEILKSQKKSANKYAAKHGLRITDVVEIVGPSNKKNDEEWLGYFERIMTGSERHILLAKADRVPSGFRHEADIADMPKDYGKVLRFFKDGSVGVRNSPAIDFSTLFMAGLDAAVSASTERGRRIKTALKAALAKQDR